MIESIACLVVREVADEFRTSSSPPSPRREGRSWPTSRRSSRSSRLRAGSPAASSATAGVAEKKASPLNEMFTAAAASPPLRTAIRACWAARTRSEAPDEVHKYRVPRSEREEEKEEVVEEEQECREKLKGREVAVR